MTGEMFKKDIILLFRVKVFTLAKTVKVYGLSKSIIPAGTLVSVDALTSANTPPNMNECGHNRPCKT